MRVYPISTTVKPNFKHKDDTRTPAYTTDHLYPQKDDTHVLGYTTTYVDTQRFLDALRDYHTTEMINNKYSLTFDRPTNAFSEETEQIVKRLENSGWIKIGKNSYRGPYLQDEKLQLAKDVGIKCVVDFTNNINYAYAVNEHFLDYFVFSEDINSMVFKDYDLAINRRYDAFRGTEKEFNEACRPIVEKFASLIKIINDGNCYVGCWLGTHRTDFMMWLIRTFSPEMDPREFDYPLKRSHLTAIKNLYDKLTDSDKRIMGWTKDTEKTFLSYLKKQEKIAKW